MKRLTCSGILLVLLPLAAGIDSAAARSATTPAATCPPTSKWSPVDYDFVAQANLGAPFQVDSGRIAEVKASTAAIRDYARLMVDSHIPVVDALDGVVRREGNEAPPNTLLQSAYRTMIGSLEAESGAAFDREYVAGQVEYQKGNTALFRSEIQNGTDPDVKAFARATLPKIEDHLQRASKLANDEVR
jgi:putative membrane protein